LPHGKDLQEAIRTDGHDFNLESWDWDLYSEQVRLAKYQCRYRGPSVFVKVFETSGS